MYKIAYVPLDERPCNYSYPNFIGDRGTDSSSQGEVEIVRPDLGLMGNKKVSGDTEKIWEWLYEEAVDSNGLILSLDTLLFGGIIPSRLHHLTLNECRKVLARLSRIKEINPDVKIYAFNLIMRCPKYSSSDEEPDYYADWGSEIFQYGKLHHLISANLASEEDYKQYEKLKLQLPQRIVDDYLSRRKINVEVNKLVLEYVNKGLIDFLIIPQDDSAPYGWTAIDQQEVRGAIASYNLELDVYMYPGADEVGCTLLARMINSFKGKRPLVYPVFSSTQGPSVTPLYEDRPLLETIKYQILAAGGLITSNRSEADFSLFVNSPVEPMMEAAYQDNLSTIYQVNRNLIDFVEQLEFIMIERNIPCVVGDVAFANGSDLALLKLLKRKDLLFQLAGYAGWNTSSNTLGTCIAQGMLHNIYGNTQQHTNFLALRYVEDAGYCSYVRNIVTNTHLPHLGYDYFLVDGRNGRVSEIVQEQLNEFIKENLNDKDNEILINKCYMPWSRMFEVGLEVEHISTVKIMG
ncbi:Protein of unknown function [Psychrobacillus psychrotolerans]|uniref:DUF4127 family protein n=1 Tax=Psychrobacillus psychrotolerans TaxID=126156 RepID=A0A1I5Y0Q0_9BACI|nr:DUF4127 family protein [Psychrobacillus psychrotolerans]SFQ37778.1 Protein of unknown function [Psychrobacillus psychrotolerans]